MELKQIRRHLKNNKTELRLLTGRYAFADKERVSGWYDDANPNRSIVSVATNRPKQEWLSTLYHEYNHLRQRLLNNTVYQRSIIKKTDEFCGNIYNSYIGNSKKIKRKTALMALRRLVHLELDCEIKTVRLMKKSNKFSQKYIDYYIRKTNSDLFEYIFFFHYRKYKTNSKSTKHCHHVMTAMPDKIMPLDYYFKQFKKYRPFFEAHFLS